MFIDVDKYVEFLHDNEINANQYLFCYLLATEDYDNITKVMRDNPLKIQEIDELIAYGRIMIRDWDKNDPRFKLRNVMITESFKKKLIIDTDDAAEELWKSYFDYGYWNDQRVPARDISPEELAVLYKKIIKNNQQEHERILNITKQFVKSREYAQRGLRKYVENRDWELLEKEGLGSGKSSIRILK